VKERKQERNGEREREKEILNREITGRKKERKRK
jgi:hypothetical protein